MAAEASHFLPGTGFPQPTAGRTARHQPASIGAEPGSGRPVERQFADLLALVGIPDTNTGRAAIRPMTARHHPGAIWADRGKSNIVLRAEHHPLPWAVPVEHMRRIAVRYGDDPTVGAGAGSVG